MVCRCICSLVESNSKVSLFIFRELKSRTRTFWPIITIMFVVCFMKLKAPDLIRIHLPFHIFLMNWSLHSYVVAFTSLLWLSSIWNILYRYQVFQPDCQFPYPFCRIFLYVADIPLQILDWIHLVVCPSRLLIIFNTYVRTFEFINSGVMIVWKESYLLFHVLYVFVLWFAHLKKSLWILFGDCLSYFSIAMTKYHGQNNI